MISDLNSENMRFDVQPWATGTIYVLSIVFVKYAFTWEYRVSSSNFGLFEVVSDEIL
jgi:hypothetical protein